MTLIKTYEEELAQTSLLDVAVQPLQKWAPLGENLVKTEYDVFLVEDPCTVDLLAVVDLHADNRETILCWQTGRSDVEGCFLLHSPEVVKPHELEYSSPHVPILCRMDELSSRGLIGLARRCVHQLPITDSALNYDTRSLPTKRSDLQSLLVMDELFTAGVVFS